MDIENNTRSKVAGTYLGSCSNFQLIKITYHPITYKTFIQSYKS